MKKRKVVSLLGLLLTLAMLTGMLMPIQAYADEEDTWLVFYYLTCEDGEAGSEGALAMSVVDFLAENESGVLWPIEDSGQEVEVYRYYPLSGGLPEGASAENAPVAWNNDAKQLILNNYNVDYSPYLDLYKAIPDIWIGEDGGVSSIIDAGSTDVSLVIRGNCSIAWTNGSVIGVFGKQDAVLKISKGSEDASLSLTAAGRGGFGDDTWPNTPVGLGGEESVVYNEVALTLRSRDKTEEEAEWWDLGLDGKNPEDRIYNSGTIDGYYPQGPEGVHINEAGMLYSDEEGNRYYSPCDYWKVGVDGRLAKATEADYQLYYDEANRTLELKDFVFEGNKDIPFYAACGITLKLTGNNKITAGSGRAILIDGGLDIIGTGRLEVISTCEDEIIEGNHSGPSPAMTVNGTHFRNECTLTFSSQAVVDLELYNVPSREAIENTGIIIGHWGTASDDGVNLIPQIDEETIAQVQDFVARMYNVALGRNYDIAGLNDWTTQLLTHENDGAGIARGFFLSKEFLDKELDKEAFVDTLYRTFFNREPDAEGRQDWLNALTDGQSREFVLSGFVNSVEFDNLCESYGIARGILNGDGTAVNPGIRQFVERMYTKALNRDGEKAGIEDWVNRLITGTASPETVAKSFFLSDELAGQQLNEQEYVLRLYRTFLDREPGIEEAQDWIDRLESGELNREQVLEGFSGSVEFGEIAEGFGL